MNDERLEELERHRLRKTALVQLELRADDDHRTARIIDALAEQVLTEPALLALQHVGQRLQRTLAAAANCLRATAIVEQCVHGFLKHALFVAQNYFRRAVRDELHQPVVAVDDSTIEIVEVGRREAAAVEGNERPKIRRNYRYHVHDHPLRLVAGVALVARIAERVHNLKALQHLLLAMLRAFVHQTRAQIVGNLVDVDALEKLAHRRGSDVGVEGVIALVPCLRFQLEIPILVEQLVLGYFLLARLDDDVVRVVDDLLEVAEREVHEVPHGTRKSLEEPDVGDGYGELDVAHALAPNASKSHLDAAAIADHTAITDALVFAAVAFPVLYRTEDPLAEEAVLLRLERAVVDRLGLEHLAPRPPGAEALHLQPLPLLGILRPSHLLG